MQTNIIFKIKKYITNIFKKKITVKNQNFTGNPVNSENKELIAGGFTMAPEHYIRKYKKEKESD